MTATRTTTASLVPHRASGYTGRGRELQNGPDWLVVRPSGAFLSTVLDLAKWDAALSSNTILKRHAGAGGHDGTKLAVGHGQSQEAQGGDEEHPQQWHRKSGRPRPVT